MVQSETPMAAGGLLSQGEHLHVFKGHPAEGCEGRAAEGACALLKEPRGKLSAQVMFSNHGDTGVYLTQRNPG